MPRKIKGGTQCPVYEEGDIGALSSPQQLDRRPPGSRERFREAVSGPAIETSLRTCRCGGARTLVRVTSILHADHDSRVYACRTCGALHSALVELERAA